VPGTCRRRDQKCDADRHDATTDDTTADTLVEGVGKISQSMLRRPTTIIYVARRRGVGPNNVPSKAAQPTTQRAIDPSWSNPYFGANNIDGWGALSIHRVRIESNNGTGDRLGKKRTVRYSCADVRASSVGGVEECMPSPSKGRPVRLANNLPPTGTWLGEPPQHYRT
jgi:hypothetical protein